MSSSDAALLEEIARLTNAIDRHKSGDAQPPTQHGASYSKRFQPSWRPPYASKYNAHSAKPYKPYPSVQQPSREVVIDGVRFQSKGKSLVRKSASQDVNASTQSTLVASTVTAGSSGSSTPQPPPVQPAAQPLIRVRNGLVAANLYKPPPPKPIATTPRTTTYPSNRVKGKRSKFHKNRTLTVTQKKKPEKQCPRFTMHGICSYGLTCRYTHDPDKISLCPLFLKGTCPHKDDPSGCSLSHDPTPERTPVCSRFNATGECWKGSDCLFPHIRVGEKEGVCKDFAVYGYCEKGAQCPSNHVKECPQFAATGKCDRAGLKGAAACTLPHVIRANRKKQGGTASAPAPTASPSRSPTLSSATIKRKAGVQESQNHPVAVLGLHESKRAKGEPGQDSDAVSSAKAGYSEGPSRAFDSEFISLTFLESDEDEEEGDDDDDDENSGDDGDDDMEEESNDNEGSDAFDDGRPPDDTTQMYDT